MKQDLDGAISSSKNGCLGALEILIRKNQTKVYNTAYYITGSKVAAQEISCKVFIKLYADLNEYKEDVSLLLWLYKDTIKCSLEFFEKNSNSLSGGKSSGKPRQERLIDGIQSLPQEQRVFIVLHDVQKLSYTEIAKILDCSQDKVKIVLQRGRLALKKYLFQKTNLNKKIMDTGRAFTS